MLKNIAHFIDWMWLLWLHKFVQLQRTKYYIYTTDTINTTYLYESTQNVECAIFCSDVKHASKDKCFNCELLIEPLYEWHYLKPSHKELQRNGIYLYAISLHVFTINNNLFNEITMCAVTPIHFMVIVEHPLFLFFFFYFYILFVQNMFSLKRLTHAFVRQPTP